MFASDGHPELREISVFTSSFNSQFRLVDVRLASRGSNGNIKTTAWPAVISMVDLRSIHKAPIAGQCYVPTGF